LYQDASDQYMIQLGKPTWDNFVQYQKWTDDSLNAKYKTQVI